MNDPGYIYCTGWKKFQHYHDRPMVWMKLYAELLDNDAFRSLSNADRGLLLGIWLLTARAGNGRIAVGSSQSPAKVQPESSQSPASLRQLSNQLGSRVRQLEPLIQAGFITIRASKAAKPRYQRASQEERRGYSNKRTVKKDSPKVVADTNGTHPDEKPLTREQRRREAQEALARIASLSPIKEL